MIASIKIGIPIHMYIYLSDLQYIPISHRFSWECMADTAPFANRTKRNGHVQTNHAAPLFTVKHNFRLPVPNRTFFVVILWSVLDNVGRCTRSEFHRSFSGNLAFAVQQFRFDFDCLPPNVPKVGRWRPFATSSDQVSDHQANKQGYPAKDCPG